MALLHADGFEGYATAEITQVYTQIASNPSIAPAIGSYGRRSTNGIAWVSGSGANQSGKSVYFIPTSPAPSGATCIFGAAFTHSTLGFTALASGIASSDPNGGGTTYAGIFYIRQGGTTHVYFRLNTSGLIEAYRGDNTLLGTATVPLQQDVTTYLEFKVVISDASGTVDVHKDGASIMSLSSKDTKNTSSATWDEIAFGHFCVSGVASWKYDDMYLLDGTGSAPYNDFLGDVRVDALIADGAGNYAQFTPSAGSNYQNIDDTSTDGDSTYNESGTVGHRDSFTFGNVPVAGTNILGVMVMCFARKTDAGTVGHKAFFRISSTDYDSSELNPSSSYSALRSIWELSPATSTAWTDTELNGAEVGYTKSS